jgi:lipopolysaccharide transport system ATP-binding protein
MSDVVIRAEGLGKKYIIGHETRRESYTALRDVIARGAQNILRKARDMVHGRPIIEGDELEEVWALRNVNFEVGRGEVVGIIGRNGAGKSTLLKTLSRITDPSEGRVSIKGRVASLLEVGTGFHPELTGRENIFLNGAILGMARTEIKRKFDEIVAFAEVAKFLDTPVKRYSSGMYVRLAFAVAAHLDPDILIIDEVLAVGDAQFQQKCLQKMEGVASQGRTILFVSHNLPSIQSLCTRAILLDHGKLTAVGAPHTIIQQYLGGGHFEAQRQWPASKRPKNAVAEIASIAIRDQQNAIASNPTTDQPVSIAIDYIVNQPDVALGLTVLLYNERHELVLSSINNHEPQWYGRSMSRGSYRTICTIPGHLLNDGGYSVSIILFGRNFADAHTVEECVGFTVIDGPGVRGDYFGEFKGAIRPLLDWKTEQL